MAVNVYFAENGWLFEEFLYDKIKGDCECKTPVLLGEIFRLQ